MRPRLAVLGFLAFLGSGCATMAHGRFQQVLVTSEPAGAAVFEGSRLMGITPTQLKLARRPRHLLRIEKEGFLTREIVLKRGGSAWTGAGNGAMAFLVSRGGETEEQQAHAPRDAMAWLGVTVGIDFLIGAAYRLQKAVHAELDRKR
jgi:hypothetical protein